MLNELNFTIMRTKKYHFIYHIRILIGSKKNYFYVGLHSTNNIDDGYCGSGTVVSDIIKSYRKRGYKNNEIYKRTIITFATSRAEVIELESIYVTNEIRDNEYCLNNISGGKANCEYSDETRKRMSKALKGRKFSDETRKRNSEAQKQYYIDHPEARDKMSKTRKQYYIDHPEARDEASKRMKDKFLGEQHPMYGKTHSDESIDKMSKTRKQYYIEHPEARDKMSKTRKQYYIDHPEAHEENSKRVKQYFIEHPEAGIEHSKKISGKNNKNYGKHWYNNGIDEHPYFDGEEPEGWVRGRLKSTCNKITKTLKGNEPWNKGKITGMHWYNNGIDECTYIEDEQPEGWVRGRLLKKSA